MIAAWSVERLGLAPREIEQSYLRGVLVKEPDPMAFVMTFRIFSRFRSK
jgi:hypothetical protein